MLDLEQPGSDARRIIMEECRRALQQDGSGSIVLGCAGMADSRPRSPMIWVPVIDGVAAAVKFVEALVGLGLRDQQAW